MECASLLAEVLEQAPALQNNQAATLYQTDVSSNLKAES